MTSPSGSNSGKKVFDVAKPGKSKPNIGAKPMIVGHKSVSIDPMMKDRASGQSDDKNSPGDAIKVTGAPELSLARGKVKVEPISEDMKRSVMDKFKKTPVAADTDADQDDDAAAAKEELSKKTAPTTEADSSSTPESKQPPVQADLKKPAAAPASPDSKPNAQAATAGKPGSEETKIDPAVVAQERAERIRRLVESKQYRVDIKEGGSSAIRSFVVAFLLAVVIGFVALYILVDLEVLKVNVELPFRVFGG